MMINKKEILVVYSTTLLITLLACLFFNFTGYPRVVTATETLDIIAPPIYMIPVFIPYGILIGELIWNWIKNENWKISILFFIECSIVALFSFFRYVLRIPYSGHTLILAFYLLHQFITNENKNPFRIFIGIFVLFITVIYKLMIWNDIITFILGVLLGIAVWIPGFIYRMRFFKE